MAQASDIREKMEVLGSDGGHVGVVDSIEDERIKLTRKDSADGQHHFVPLSSVSRVDAHVHLDTTAAALGIAAGVGVAATTGDGHGPLPPVHNRVVGDAPARGNYYLPWIVGLVGLLLLFFLVRGCMDRDDAINAETPPPPVATGALTAPAAAPALPVEAVALPDGTSVNVEPNSLNYTLQRFLASTEAAPRTFQFDKLNFDTGSAAIRPEDQANVDALAQILASYPNARGQVVGYTDARGSTPSNAQLGRQRADAVVAALAAKGIAAGRLTAASGGEANPTDTNTTGEGQFENRRTELVVTAK